MKNLTLYWLPHCTTCQKAVKFLEAKGAKIDQFRNLKEDRLSHREVAELAAAVGGADELFSRRAIKYREMKLNEREISGPEMLDLMAGEYTFIKRPVLVDAGRGIAGFSEKNYEKFLKTDE